MKQKPDNEKKSETRDDSRPKNPPRDDDESFPVAGIGASAGGLEAFTQLLKALPKNPGMAFVLVPHLDPLHKSAMTELLARATAMPVVEVHDGMRVKRDHVYVIPPNSEMTIAGNILHLTLRESRGGQHLPIDTFLRSLAVDRQAPSGARLSMTRLTTYILQHPTSASEPRAGRFYISGRNSPAMLSTQSRSYLTAVT